MINQQNLREGKGREGFLRGICWGHGGKWAGTGGDKGKEQDLRKTREEWRGAVRVSRSFWGGAV